MVGDRLYWIILCKADFIGYNDQDYADVYYEFLKNDSQKGRKDWMYGELINGYDENVARDKVKEKFAYFVKISNEIKNSADKHGYCYIDVTKYNSMENRVKAISEALLRQ